MRGFEYDPKNWKTDPKVDRYMREVHPEVGPEVILKPDGQTIPRRGNTARDGYTGRWSRGRR